MLRNLLISGLLAALLGPGAGQLRAQTHSFSALPALHGSGGEQTVDGVAARIEDDILTESEVRELAGYQQLVDGKAKPRAEILRELEDQWIVRGEAKTAKFPEPSAEDQQRAFAEFAKLFASPEDFQRRCAAAGMTQTAVRRIVFEQLYLSRFIDYRFRPAAQVDDAQVQTFYQNEFAPQLKARGQPVPALDEVQDTIREVLVQRAIGARAEKWLDETRAHLKIDIVSAGSGS